MRIRATRSVTLAAFASLLLTSCAPPGSGVDETMTLDQAKARAQSIEREIAETLTPDVLTDVDQRSMGTFLPCAGGDGEHWAGGLTASVMGDPPSERVTGQIASHFSDREDLKVRLRVDHGDSLVDIIGAHGSMWIVRYSREQAELDVDSFAPCVRLPEGVWRGDKY